MAVETNFTQKIKSEEDLPEREFIGIFEETFDANKDPYDGTKPDWRGEDRGEMRTAFLGSKTTSSKIAKTSARPGLLHKFHATISPRYQPQIVEALHSVELPALQGGTFKVEGTLDFFGLNGDRDYVIADWKFRNRSKSGEEALSDQLTTYDYMVKKSKLKPKKLELVVSTYGTKEPKIEILPTTRTKTDHERVIGEYQRMWLQLEILGDDPENYPQVARDHWACSAKWCGWWKFCPRGGGDFYSKKKGEEEE